MIRRLRDFASQFNHQERRKEDLLQDLDLEAITDVEEAGIITLTQLFIIKFFIQLILFLFKR